MLSSLRNDRKDPAAIKRRALALMEKAGIAELAERDISKVSGGQLQRAGVCRALMGEPEILFCDEPTGALNSRSAQEIMSLFSSINTDGTAIMLVTHDAKISAQSERVIFMRDGKIASELKLGNDDLNKRDWKRALGGVLDTLCQPFEAVLISLSLSSLFFLSF